MFAVFDGSKSEDDILQTISSAIYSDVCLARQEVSVQWCTFAVMEWSLPAYNRESKLHLCITCA